MHCFCIGLHIALLWLILCLSLCECQDGGCLKDPLVYINEVAGSTVWQGNNYRHISYNYGRYENFRFLNHVRTSAIGSLYFGIHLTNNNERVHLFIPNSTVIDVPHAIVLHQQLCVHDILEQFYGGTRLLTPIIDILADSSSNNETILVLPSIGVEALQTFSSLNRFRDWNQVSTKFFLFRMLQSVRFVHDVGSLWLANLNPESFLISPDTGRVFLLDLGKAVFAPIGGVFECFNVQCVESFFLSFF